MINFFACQPALNYGFKKPDSTMPWQKSSDDPAVRRVWEETKNIMKFWLDLGCDGFRVDMAPSLVKGDPDGDGIREIWHYYRSWLDENYPEAVLISEWSCPPKAIDAGFHIDFMIHFGQEGFRDLFLRENCFFSRDGKGDASRFSLIADEYSNSPEITSTRLYIEAVESVIKNGGENLTIVDKNLKSFIPFKNVGGAV